jgi:CheY-like chemotaxis protein
MPDSVVLIVEDDRNEREALEYLFSGAGLECTGLREPEEASQWLESAENTRRLKIVVLDLMFPPRKAPPQFSDLNDLTPGVSFYKKALAGKYWVMLLTGALRFTRLKERILTLVEGEKRTILQLKPVDPASVIDAIKKCLAEGEW